MIKTEMTNRQKQALLTKKKIFAAAKILIQKMDFDDITVKIICGQAKVSVGTFYVYYKTKHDVLFELYTEVDTIFINANLLEDSALNCKEKTLGLIRLQMQFTVDSNIKIAKQLYSAHLFSNNAFFLSEERGFFKILNAIVIEGQKNDEITSSIDSKVISWNILRFCRGIIFDWLIRSADYDLEKTAMDELKRYLTTY